MTSKGFFWSQGCVLTRLALWKKSFIDGLRYGLDGANNPMHVEASSPYLIACVYDAAHSVD